MKYTISSFLLLFFFACKSSSETTGTTPSTMTPEQTLVNTDSTKNGDIYALLVNFYSIGSGTENELMRKMEDFIGDYTLKIKKNIDFEKYGWGREGETDYCFRLAELSQPERKDFIAALSDLLKEGKW